ncbi:efflux transporter outer membrane subunit [Pseudomonas tolaasii]|uniref:Efflux transporter outer membrane subunit n=2 Tax=Pseudomonas tolaasii TaxID=29442 RepID=A0A7Y8AKX3_PSETO|nr:efflux transporter outer membrane subunit [Pseudomonas tolaasii]ARB30606.1 RND transporter [Pseudomonas tolaasii]KAB0468880.1 efflux transporter outer membrane subunit [Pseudomonas tolaasii]MBY8941918.1 efflux transporter outer membrane subunit [Pseudomonas tolaasii]NWC23862.1 efflux transporter outer membrane subunit [Pseudomonas tolaasii]NWD34468.1 efflux transporter outer membrane subunit [Pseudomonas tolaasii]
MIVRSFPLLLTVGLLSACTVGPDYKGAPDVAPKTLAAGQLPHADKAAQVAPAVAQWWRTLGDAKLNELVDHALQNSPDIATAQARLKQSRASLSGASANAMPKVTGDAAMLRLRSPDTSALGGGNSGGGRGPLSLYLAGFDASWEADLFGGTRRAVEAAQAEADASQAQLADAQVQLAAEIVQAYTDLRDQQARLALVDASVDIENQALDLTQQRRSRGVASQLQLEQVLTQAENTQAQRLPLQAAIVESLDQLGLLCGREPGELDGQLATARALPSIPSQVPLADPAALLKARPDIRMAERKLASANAQIGEKTADWFPKLSLMGDLSFSAGDPGHLARKDNGTWLILPRLSWNALDFGRVAASVKGAEAGRDEALAQYKSTVLTALRDADVALARYGHQRQNVVLLRNVEASAIRAADLTRQRYRAGTASTLDWLDAERTRYQAQESRISGDAELLKDFASLHKALGLGWTL